MNRNEACGLLTTDAQGNIIDANPTLASYLGCELPMLIGRPLISLFPPAGRILFQTQALPLLKLRHQLEEFYITLKRQDGCDLPVILNAVEPVSDRSSTLHWAMIPMARRDQLETELINARVKANEALIAKEEATRAAESANRAKTAFLASMSHEIRTPMNAVLGMTTLLLDSPQSEQQREWTEIIRSSGEHLLGLINDILDFSKIESGRFELERHPFSLPECLDAAINLVALTASRRRLDLSCRIHAGVPEMIVGDAARLRQIVLNLLSNAIKFTPEGGDVAVDVRPADDGAGKLHFSVRDTGIGLTEDQQTRLFQPFVQADASTSRLYGGTGLGLSISRRLVEAMGGTIGVSSRPGLGATFHFTLVAPPTEDSGSGLLGNIPTLRGRRVLLVEPDARGDSELAHYPLLWGMEVRTATTADEVRALQSSAERFDVLVLGLRAVDRDTSVEQQWIDDLAPLKISRRILIVTAGLEPGVGNFDATIHWPLSPERLRQALQAQPSPPAAAGSTTPSLPHELGAHHPLRILIAEDNPVNVKLAKLLFNQMGFQPDFAGNGVEVLAAIERQPYDVIFMDVRMPVMDGLQTTRQVCEGKTAMQRPRIIGMSASAMDEDRAEALAAGMDDYVTKPIVLEELVRSLQECRRRTEPAPPCPLVH